MGILDPTRTSTTMAEEDSRSLAVNLAVKTLLIRKVPAASVFLM